jgi:hypothetical protein
MLAIQRQAEEDEEEPAQTLAIQRQAEEDEEEPAQAFAVQRQDSSDDEDSTVQPQANGHGGTNMAAAATLAIHSRGAGQPLIFTTRGALERSLGVDLGLVRVHATPGAHRAARSLRARAFTHRNHIWLGAGESQADLKLMAHEATHVLQQDGIVRRKPAESEEQTPAPGATDRDLGRAPEPLVAGAPIGVDITAESSSAAMATPGDATSPIAGVSSQPPAEATGEDQQVPGQSLSEPAPEIAGETEGAPVAGEAGESSDAQGQQRLSQVLKNVNHLSKQQQGVAAAPNTARTTATAKVTSASRAAPSPDNEAEAQGKGAQVEVMAEQEKGEVDKKSFLDLVKEKLRQMDMPSNPQQMDQFKQRGGASSLKGDVAQGAKAQQVAAQSAIAGATEAEPKPAPPRVPDPAPIQDQGPKPKAINSQEVLPPPKSESEISLQAGKDEVDAELARERLTTERLENANDPRFSSAQEARAEVETHVEQGPEDYRETETQTLKAERAAAQSDERRGAGKMETDRQQSDAGVLGQQKDQMSKEAAARRKIATDLDAMYEATKKKVEGKLTWLDEQVDQEFTRHEARARQRFEDFVKDEFDDWKDRRYSGLKGKWTWVEDRFRDINELPAVKQIYVDGQELYYDTLDSGIDEIGRLIDSTLEWCQEEIRKGRDAIKTYLSNLGDDLKQIGAEVGEDVLGKYDDLKGQVEDHREALADTLVQRYQESREKLNARIEEIKDANRSLVIRAKRKIEAVIEAIRNFRDRLMSILARVRAVVELILDDPIGFLKNLVQAVKQGFDLFKKYIWKHLEAGIFGWLFGALAGMGMELPKDFSFKSVIGFILSVVGVTWNNLRRKAERLVGRRNVAVLEKVVGYLQTLFTDGPAGLWQEISQDVGNLYDTVLQSVKEWVVTRIVTAAIAKLVSMFNPVGAIVQAVLTIYNVVMFFVERIEQIMQLVETIVSSLADIVAGRIGQAAAFVERALGQMVPLIIAFLARLLGLGGIAQQVKKIIDKVRGTVDRAIDKALKRVVAHFTKLVKSAAASGKAAVLKLMEWWKIRKQFKQGKQSHTLHFKGGRKNPTLMISSTPDTLESYMSKLAGRQPPPDKAVVAEIRAQMKLVDGLKRDPASGTDIKMSKKVGLKIAKALTEIAKQLSKLGGKEARPPSKISYPEQQPWAGDSDGKKMIAMPLSIDPGGHSGSVPREESNLWSEVNNRTGEYVRGHLLNHHLHGPGTKVNMTPITRSLNADMEKQVEDKAKRAVLGENQVVHYEVEAVYGGQPGRTGLPAERNLPISLKFVLKSMKLKQDSAGDKPDDWVDDKDLGAPKQLGHKLPPDTPVGKKPDPVNLSTATKAQLMAVPGIGPSIAQGILDLRRKRAQEGLKVFYSYDQLEDVKGLGETKVAELAEKRWIRLR